MLNQQNIYIIYLMLLVGVEVLSYSHNNIHNN